MKLSRKKSIELCIEVWTWCAETGKPKEEWPRWSEFNTEYNTICNHCWFCDYDSIQLYKFRHKSCFYCPLKSYFKCHCSKTAYGKWAKVKTRRTRKKYAALFLAQIKEVYAERKYNE